MSVQIADKDTNKFWAIIFFKKSFTGNSSKQKFVCFSYKQKEEFFLNYYNLFVNLFCFDWSRIFDDSRRRWRNDWK